jgi:cytochrome c5
MRAAATFLLALGMATGCQRPPAAQALSGARYLPGQRFVERHCASCHADHGRDRLRARAHRVFAVDRYAQWQSGGRILLAVLDKWHLDGKVMPPPQAAEQPSDDERRQILDWIRRGSPNTPDGRAEPGITGRVEDLGRVPYHRAAWPAYTSSSPATSAGRKPKPGV